MMLSSARLAVTSGLAVLGTWRRVCRVPDISNAACLINAMPEVLRSSASNFDSSKKPILQAPP